MDEVAFLRELVRELLARIPKAAEPPVYAPTEPAQPLPPAVLAALDELGEVPKETRAALARQARAALASGQEPAAVAQDILDGEPVVV